jgi:hypothetical protein
MGDNTWVLNGLVGYESVGYRQMYRHFCCQRMNAREQPDVFRDALMTVGMADARSPAFRNRHCSGPRTSCPGPIAPDAQRLDVCNDLLALGPLGYGIRPGTSVLRAVAELGHVLLYRSYQSQLHGFWRGGLIWLADTINSYVRPKFRFARD